MTSKQKLVTIMSLSGLAFVNAFYLSYKAYFSRFIDPQGLSSFCDISSVFSCTEVLRHPLSQVFGVSFPWVAFIVYPVILCIAYFAYRKTHACSCYVKTLAVLSGMGMIFNGFIIYREVMYIHSYCILCLICTAIIVSIFGLSVSMLKVEGRK